MPPVADNGNPTSRVNSYVLFFSAFAAAIFVFCFWATKPFAEEYSKGQFDKLRTENELARKVVQTVQVELTSVSYHLLPALSEALMEASTATKAGRIDEANRRLAEAKEILVKVSASMALFVGEPSSPTPLSPALQDFCAMSHAC
jgi:hypothetical protein